MRPIGRNNSLFLSAQAVKLREKSRAALSSRMASKAQIMPCWRKWATLGCAFKSASAWLILMACSLFLLITSSSWKITSVSSAGDGPRKTGLGLTRLA